MHKDTFTTCHECAVGIVNGDDSAWEDWADDEKASADAAIEYIGNYDSFSIEDSGRYFDCFVCDDACLGDEYTFVTGERY